MSVYEQKGFEDYIDNINNGWVSASVSWHVAKSVIKGKLSF